MKNHVLHGNAGFFIVGVMFNVRAHHKTRQHLILEEAKFPSEKEQLSDQSEHPGSSLYLNLVDGVSDNTQHIKARHDGFRQVHVLCKGQGGVVSPTDWVTGSNDGASGLQGRDNAGFGDGNALLLHGFVDTSPVCIIHLMDKMGGGYKVTASPTGKARGGTAGREPNRPTDLIELVNQTDSVVGQHQSSGLQSPFAADWVSLDVGGQTNGRGPLAGGEDSATGHLLHIPAQKTHVLGKPTPGALNTHTPHSGDQVDAYLRN